MTRNSLSSSRKQSSTKALRSQTKDMRLLTTSSQWTDKRFDLFLSYVRTYGAMMACRVFFGRRPVTSDELKAALKSQTAKRMKLKSRAAQRSRLKG